MFPRPPLPSFKVTLLPESLHLTPGKATSAASSSTTLATTQASDHAAAKSMMHTILNAAADCSVLRRRFTGYSPEAVLRSVRALVESEDAMELVGMLRVAVRVYAQRCVSAVTVLQGQLPPGACSAEAVAAAAAASTGSDADEEELVDEEAKAASTAASLGAVQVLARLVTGWERLQEGLAELSSVWVYADQWCTAQIGSTAPRSLTAAATEAMCDVLSCSPNIFQAAVLGCVVVLRTELAAETAAALCSSAEAARRRGGDAAPLRAAVQTPPDTLAHPPSLASLDAPLRQRLLRLFTQLARAMQRYTTQVEPAVVGVVRLHYERTARRLWAADVNARAFFAFCDDAIKGIAPMSTSLLHPSTAPLLEDAVQSSLLSAVGEEVLKRDFAALVERGDYKPLRLAWRLLSAAAHVRSSPVVAGLFHEYLMDCGQRIMEELVPGSTKATLAAAQVPPRERPFLAVRHLLGLLELGSCTVTECFAECEKEFKVALHEDLQVILEAHPHAFSEQLAAYQDAIMKEVEAGHVPVVAAPALSTASPDHGDGKPAGEEAAAAEEAEADDEGGASRAPLRRPRIESPSRDPVVNAADEEENDGGRGERPAAATAAEVVVAVVVGAAALRHAAPLPAEVKDATAVLRQIAVIYSYHPKKDLFEAAYWRDFSRRCLHAHRQVNSAAENTFICFLRDICGLSFTSKFEGMLTDLTSSTELTAQFKTWTLQQQQPQQQPQQSELGEARQSPTATAAVPRSEAVLLDTRLFILTQSYWPKYPPQPASLYIPPAMQAVAEHVTRFYTGLFPNRHLSWQHPLSHASLTTRLTPHSATLTLSGTFMQCVLLMRLDALHDRGVAAVTAKELCDAVGLDVTNVEVLSSLQGLCHPRCRIVLREEGAAAAATATMGRQRRSAEVGRDESEGGDGGHHDAEEAEEGIAGAAAAGLSSLSSPATASPASPTAVAGGGSHTLSPTDVLRLNLAFTSTTSKVRIPLQTRMRAAVSAGLDGPSRGSRTADNGGHLVEVAIVGCLKAQRVMTHADLASAVAARLPFTVTTAALKKAMDKMIERGFVVRERGNTYVYSA